MKIKLDDIAWKVPKGHRLRVSISTTYFPMIWRVAETSRAHRPCRTVVADTARPKAAEEREGDRLPRAAVGPAGSSRAR